jgi:hypothetical protein
MAVALEMINLIIRRDAIEQKFDGGWSGYLRQAGSPKEIPFWYDDHLLREGAMSSNDIEKMVSWWRDRGLVEFQGKGRHKRWADFCVIACPFYDTTPPCDWIAISTETHSASRHGFDAELIKYPQCYF